MSGRECTTGQDVEDFANEMRREKQVISSVLNSESNKLIIELSNLNEGSIRTIKRDLKVLVEDYGYKKMISGCIQVKEEE